MGRSHGNDLLFKANSGGIQKIKFSVRAQQGPPTGVRRIWLYEPILPLAGREAKPRAVRADSSVSVSLGIFPCRRPSISKGLRVSAGRLVTDMAAHTTARQLCDRTGTRPRTHAQSLKKSDAVPMSCRSARCARARSMNIAPLLRRIRRDTSSADRHSRSYSCTTLR